MQCVPKMGGIIVVPNSKGELLATRLVTGWRLFMDNKMLNSWIEKGNFLKPFMEQMLHRVLERGWYCLLDGYCGYNKMSMLLEDQEKPFWFSLTRPLYSKGWHSYYAMLWENSKVACCLSLKKWWKTLYRSSWITFSS